MGAVLVPEGPDSGIPWHYGDPLREQRSLAAGEGVVDLSNRGVLTISGPDRLDWLHSLTSQKFAGLASGESTTAYVLSPNGHIEHVLFSVATDDVVWVWTEPGRVEALAGWLRSMQFMTRVEVTVRDDVAVVWHSCDLGLGEVVTRTGADSLGGHESFVPRDRLREALASGTPVGSWAYEARRIEAGVPRIGLDTDERTIPNELGVPSAAVALEKGCYRGQETIARVFNLGKPPRRLVRLLLDGSVEELPPLGAELRLAVDPQGRPIGFVGTTARHHELGPIALALVKRSVDPSATLVAGQVAATQELLVDPGAGVHFRARL